MLLIQLLALHLLGRVCVGNYNVYRSSCRKYAVFKATDRGKKVNGGLIGAYIVSSLPECLRRCLASGSCLTFNFSPPSNQNNCEILASSRVNGGTLEAVTNWNHYEPISQQITPGCQVNGESPACSPGYICEDICEANARFRCIDIDECASSPCLNGGTCSNLVNRYQCSCAPGYTGTRCQTDINECASSPCLNGGTCSNLVNRYQCSCAPGYTGTRCQTDINECASSPCFNGGTCSNLVNRYQCSCAPGYAGARCQTDINECASSPCYHGGTCHNYVNHYTCSCTFVWGGSRCQAVRNPFG